MKILAAIDQSEFAARVLDNAIDMTKRHDGAELVVLTVVNYSPFFLNAAEMPPDMVDSIRTRADELIQWARETAQTQGLSVEAVVREGYSPADQIVQHAETNAVDCIVLGHKGANAVERFLMGSVALGVAAHSPCSVFIVR